MTADQRGGRRTQQQDRRAKSSSRVMSYDGSDIMASLANKAEALAILLVHMMAVLFYRRVVIYWTCVGIVMK